MADISKFNYYDSGRTKVIKPTDRMVVSSGGLAFEGATDNDYETELAVVDPTADRTITFPNATGNVLIDSQDLSLADNVKIKLGTGDDLEIFHNGTNSIIKDTANSGNSTIKYLAGTQTFQNKDANKTMAVFNAASSIDLHYNGSKKFETTSAGIKTTGTVNVNNAYTLPSSDGTNGQVLTTNGSGTITFEDASSSSAFPATDTANSYTTTVDFSSATPYSNGTITIPVGKTGHLVLSEDLDNAVPSEGDLLTWDNTNQHFTIASTLDQSVVGLPGDPSTPFGGRKMLQVNNPFGSSVTYSYENYTDSIITELSIPGLDIQTDTNAFRFNCPYGMIVTGLDLYLDQHTTSGNVTVTVTNTTDSNAMISLSISGTNTSATTTTVSNATCDSGDIITFAITATPANAQGLRANLHLTRT